MRFASVLLVITFIAFSCKKDASNYQPDCSGPAKSYLVDVKPAILSNCVSCHSQYGSYNGMKNDANAIRASIANGSMPKGKSMSDAEKNKVMCWIDAGAPNN
ncbi:MAG: hypothetical protein ACKOA1_03430 [Bacteroidota bacterium]